MPERVAGLLGLLRRSGDAASGEALRAMGCRVKHT